MCLMPLELCRESCQSVEAAILLKELLQEFRLVCPHTYFHILEENQSHYRSSIHEFMLKQKNKWYYLVRYGHKLTDYHITFQNPMKSSTIWPTEATEREHFTKNSNFQTISGEYAEPLKGNVLKGTTSALMCKF